MAYITNAGGFFAGRSEPGSEPRKGIFDVVRSAIQSRAIYNRTMRELEALSDRELADLGLSRSMIQRRALEAAYDI